MPLTELAPHHIKYSTGFSLCCPRCFTAAHSGWLCVIPGGSLLLTGGPVASSFPLPLTGVGLCHPGFPIGTHSYSFVS